MLLRARISALSLLMTALASAACGTEVGLTSGAGGAVVAGDGGGAGDVAQPSASTGGADSAGGMAGVGGDGGAGGAALFLGPLWARPFGGDWSDWLMATRVIGQEIALGGIFMDTIDFGGGVLDYPASQKGFAARLNLLGHHVWSTCHGSASALMGITDIAPDGSGGFYLIGMYGATTSLGGEPLPATPGDSVMWAFMARFDSAGNHIWSKALGTAGNNCALGGHLCPAKLTPIGGSDVAVVGVMTGEVDFGLGPMTAQDHDVFVARLDSQGEPIWAQRFDGPGREYAVVARDVGDRIIVAGSFEQTMQLNPTSALTSAGERDAFLTEIDPTTGAVVWAKRFGGPGDDFARGVTASPANDIVLVGAFEGGIDLGSGALTASTNLSESFVARFDHGGNGLWSAAMGQGAFESAAFSSVGRLVVGGATGRLLTWDPLGQLVYDTTFAVASPGLDVAAHPGGRFVVSGHFAQPLDLGLGAMIPFNASPDFFVALFQL